MKPSKKEQQHIADTTLFEEANQVLLPNDFKAYLLRNNAVLDTCNHKLFEFYGLKNIRSIHQDLVFNKGIPDYSNIVNTFSQHNNCFIFADYMFALFAYGICLYSYQTAVNEVFVICGDEYRIIAHSFRDFLKLYDTDAIALQF